MRRLKLADWVNESWRDLPKGPQTAHWNEIEDLQQLPPGKARMEVVKAGTEAILKIQNILRHIGTRSEYTVACFIPIAFFDEVTMWNKAYLREGAKDNDPPSLYLLKQHEIFSIDDEEYKITINDEIMGDSSINYIYRCFRSKEHMKNNWEFMSGIYIIK